LNRQWTRWWWLRVSPDVHRELNGSNNDRCRPRGGIERDSDEQQEVGARDSIKPHAGVAPPVHVQAAHLDGIEIAKRRRHRDITFGWRNGSRRFVNP
jgi:hypothetical protein